MGKIKKTNGFTVVEILGVITLISLVALITVPAITNVMKNQKEKVYYDQLSQLVRASQNWGTDNEELLESDLSGYCKSDGTWERYELSLSDLQNGTEEVTYLDSEFINPRTDEQFENTKVYVYKKDKSYLYCVDAPDCYEEGKYPVSDEYKSTASNLCCNGDEFKQRLSECIMPEEDELLPPIATIDSSEWTQNKTATATFQGSGVSFVNSSVAVKTNVTAVACTSMNGAEYVCDGTVVVTANGTLQANTWYQINESQVQLIYNTEGVLLTRTSDGFEYIDGNKLDIVKIDTTAPTITSLSGTSTDNGYTTTKLKLTAVASDSESGILRYEFYKVSQAYSDEISLESNITGIYTLSNPVGGYDYKVKVYDNVGLSSEKTLTESCSISTKGTCSNGSKTDIYTCTTGRKYSKTTTSGCTTTTTIYTGYTGPTTNYTGYTGTTTRTTTNGGSNTITTKTATTTTRVTTKSCVTGEACNYCNNSCDGSGNNTSYCSDPCSSHFGCC